MTCSSILRGNGNIQIALHGVIAGGLSLGVERQQPSGGGDGRLGFRVVLVGVTLALGADALADSDGNFVVVGEADADRAVIVVDAQAGNGWRQILFEVVVEVEGLAEDVIQVVVVDVHVVADLAPVETRGLGGHESEDDDEDDEKDSSGADAARGHAIALRLLILDQLDHAPQDQQRRPVVSEQSSQAHPGQHVQVAQQENDAEDNQHNRSGKRAAARARWNQRWNRGGTGF